MAFLSSGIRLIYPNHRTFCLIKLGYSFQDLQFPTRFFFFIVLLLFLFHPIFFSILTFPYFQFSFILFCQILSFNFHKVLLVGTLYNIILFRSHQITLWLLLFYSRSLLICCLFWFVFFISLFSSFITVTVVPKYSISLTFPKFILFCF